MSELTLEKMDLINFLLTEVSLELLGNKFYDVYGTEHDSLNHMLSMQSVKQTKNYDERSCQLLNALNMSIFDIREDEFLPPATKPGSRKRRASATEVLDKTPVTPETYPILDPESLLVPMVAPNKRAATAGKISRRRFTCLEGRKTTSTTIQPPRPLLPAVSALRTPAAEKKPSPTAVAETSELDGTTEKDFIAKKVTNLQKQADLEYRRLLAQSQEYRESYFKTNEDLLGTAPYHSEYEIIEEFHNSEKAALMSQCNHLIEFIKFVKMDQNNVKLMGLISNCILQLKDTI